MVENPPGGTGKERESEIQPHRARYDVVRARVYSAVVGISDLPHLGARWDAPFGHFLGCCLLQRHGRVVQLHGIHLYPEEVHCRERLMRR